MASYSARLAVDGQDYPLVLCSYSFTQSTGARGRVNERVRHGLLELVLDVPHNDKLLQWAATPHYPLDGQISFYQVNGLVAQETVAFTEGQCVHYQEVFEAGADFIGSYRCMLTIAAAKLELVAGGPTGGSAAAGGAGDLVASATQVASAAQQASALVAQARQLVASPSAAVISAVGATAASPALAAMPIGGQYLYREDNAPFQSEGQKPGRLKSFIDAAGNLSPANPNGLATIQDHVRGSEPRKSDSPYTSTSGAQNVGKSYGDHEIRIDHQGLAQGIASGEVSGVEIISNAQVVAHLQTKLADAQKRYDENPNGKNQVRLERAQGDIANTQRDQEILVKGVVPAKYVEVTKKSS